MYFDPRNIQDGLFPHNGHNANQLRFLLKYAILAPSHYNAQPWKFQLDRDCVNVYLDQARVSRISDPDTRESVISCGAAAEMLEVAAHYFGKSSRIKVNKDESGGPLANIALTGRHDPSAINVAHFHAIKHRQTNRNWFVDAELPESTVDDCQLFAKKLGIELLVSQDTETTKRLASVTQRAVQRQFSNPWYRFEFTSWLRSTISFKPDGLTGFGFYRTKIPYPLSRPLLQWFGFGASTSKYNHNKLITGSPTLAIISSRDDSRASWINTGRVLSHFLLSLTASNLSASFMNQGIQEQDLRRQLHQIFGSLAKPQLILRIGKASQVQWTPRRPVEKTLI